MPTMILPPMTIKKRPFHSVLVVLSVICFFWVTIKSYMNFATKEVYHHPSNNSQRIAKVSMLYGETNHMYERALQSHERHGKKWGYPMHVLRQDISVGFWNKPSYLLALVINEMAKPAGERMEWFMWVDADSIILNNDIPVEVFLPPSDLKDIHLVTAKDQNGLNTGIMFMHVHPWTISFLTETLGYPLLLPEIDLGRSADQEAMRLVLNKTTEGPAGQGYAGGVAYLPRPWINTYEWDWAYEGKRGDLLVHFPGLGEKRWPHMAKWLDIVEMTPQKWKLPLEQTGYLTKTEAYWSQLRDAKNRIQIAEQRLQAGKSRSSARIEQAADALKKVILEDSDEVDRIQQRLEDLNALLEQTKTL